MEAVHEYGGLDLSQEKPLEDVYDGYTYFRDGDVVVAKITPCFENGKGALAGGLRNGIAFGTTELHVLRETGRIHRRFLFYLTISDRFRRLGEAAMYGAGGQKRVSEDFIEEYRAPIPPYDTQGSIADFLDRETAKIDALIEKKQRLLELLDEKRTALITRAVTRGLDLDVPMKDSGVEWIGEIPDHWEATKFRWFIARDNAGEVIDRSHWGAGGERLYSCQRTSIQSSFDGFPDHRRTQQGDLLLTRNGTPYVHLPEPGSIYTNVVQRIELRPGLNHVFAWYALASAAKSLRGFGDIIESFNMSTWKELEIAVPPVSEQSAIVDHLRDAAAHLGVLSSKAESAISLLQEYRTALISTAVTGQIKVHGKTPA